MIGQGMERLIMLNIVKLTIMVLDIPFTITMDMKKTKNIIIDFLQKTITQVQALTAKED